MIRAVHLISSLGTGGTEMMLLKLMAAMRGGEVENSVVSMTTMGELGPRIRESGIDVETLGMRQGRADPRGVLRLRRILRARRPQVLQTWLYHADLLGLLAARVSGRPRVVWNIRCSQTDARYHTGLSGLVVKALARLSPRPAAVVANSRAGVDLHARMGYRPRRWEVIPNGFDLNRFHADADARAAVRAELGIVGDAPVIGLVARLDPLKDHATFLAAARILAAARADAHFVLAGAGVMPGNPPFNQARAALGDRLHLLGPRADIPRLTAAFDIAVCSSTGEGFPNILGEAMACAVPVVTTDVGDAATVVGDGGLVVPPSDPAALAAAWARVLDLPASERAAVGERGLARVREHFAIDRIAERYAALYREIVAADA